VRVGLWEVFVGLGLLVVGVAVCRGRVVDGDAVGVRVLGVALGVGLRVAGVPVSEGSGCRVGAGGAEVGTAVAGRPGADGGVSEPPPESAAMENIVRAPATATAPTP
jgi:hypothetical protein